MFKEINTKLLDLITCLLLAGMCTDLIYLYYQGVWYDPIQVVEYVEVIFLYAISIICLVRGILLLKEFKGGK